MTDTSGLVSALAGARTYELEHLRYVGAPIFPAHWPGFVYTLHRHHEPLGDGARTSASGTVIMQEHSGTHIDALCHQAIEMEMYGGVRVTPDVQHPRGFTELGVETIEPIFRRGVLLDVPRALGLERLEPGYLVTDKDLEVTAEAQGVEIREGDCVLVRTGSGRDYDQAETYLAGAGIDGSGAAWLAERRPFLCGADNVAFDLPDNVDPELGSLPCHRILIVESGIYIVENVALEELAADQVHEFLFVCLPLRMQGVTGSPVRPVAIVTS
ncbi:cyclase family protein [Nocardioides pyridinolyticus]